MVHKLYLRLTGSSTELFLTFFVDNIKAIDLL